MTNEVNMKEGCGREEEGKEAGSDSEGGENCWGSTVGKREKSRKRLDTAGGRGRPPKVPDSGSASGCVTSVTSFL